MHIVEVLVPKQSSPYEFRLARDTIRGSSTKRVSKVSHFLRNHNAHAFEILQSSFGSELLHLYQESITRDV